MHWETEKGEKGQPQHNTQGTDAFLRAVLIPTLKASLSQCFLHLQALQSPASGGLPQSPRYHTAAAVCVVFGIHTAWWQPVGRENNVFYLFRVKHSLKSILNK